MADPKVPRAYTESFGIQTTAIPNPGQDLKAPRIEEMVAERKDLHDSLMEALRALKSMTDEFGALPIDGSASRAAALRKAYTVIEKYLNTHAAKSGRIWESRSGEAVRYTRKEQELCSLLSKFVGSLVVVKYTDGEFEQATTGRVKTVGSRYLRVSRSGGATTTIPLVWVLRVDYA